MSLFSVKNAMGVALVSVGLLSLPQTTNATPITYNVNQLIGPGSATGTITTDGTIGILADADIVSWALLLNDGTHTTILLSSAPGNFPPHVAGSALTASLTTLTFNYSAGDGSDFYLYNLTGELCYTSYSNCWGPSGVGVYNVGGDGASVYIAQTGSRIIASGGTSVPAPASLALLGLGLAGLGFSRRRKQKAAR